MPAEPTRRSRAPLWTGLVAVALAGAGIAGLLHYNARGRALPEAAPTGAGPPDAAAESTGPFIAFARDFEGFTEWERQAVEGAMLPIGTPPGPTWIYANVRPAEGAQRWPVGAMLVKVVESSPSRAGWTIHAMVKRGVPYNRDGVIGWEFFELAFADEDRPAAIVWRGEGPPSGHGYAAAHRDAGGEAIPLVCNDCHAAAWQDDGVLTPALNL